jgi:hypothetical protein
MLHSVFSVVALAGLLATVRQACADPVTATASDYAQAATSPVVLARGHAGQCRAGQGRPCGFGWGTWIRTKDARVRAGSFTAKLSPKGARTGAITCPPPRRNAFRET